MEIDGGDGTHPPPRSQLPARGLRGPDSLSFTRMLAAHLLSDSHAERRVSLSALRSVAAHSATGVPRGLRPHSACGQCLRE